MKKMERDMDSDGDDDDDDNKIDKVMKDKTIIIK
jgi:hypothetical protein